MADNTSNPISNILSDPDTMQAIMGLVSGLQGGDSADKEDCAPQADNSGEDISSLLNNMDLIIKIQKAMEILSEDGDNQTNLLSAIKPYLSQKRLKNVDKAITLMRLSKLSGLLEGMI